MKHKLQRRKRGYYRFGNYQVMKIEDRWYASLSVPGFPTTRVCEGLTLVSVFHRLQRALFPF